MKINVLDVNYNQVGECELDDSLFGVEPRKDILSRVVRWQLAKKRSGNHQTRTISMVSGTGKKCMKQKGSGGARHGSKRANQFRGGAIIFGPVVRSHEYKLQKSVRKLGLRMAISDKIIADKLILMNELNSLESKTKSFVDFYSNKGIKSAVFVDEEKNHDVLKALSNCHFYNFLPQIGLNVYDIIKHESLIMSVSSIKAVEKRLKNG